ncbi:MAG: hypothetical protein KGL39_32955 [Patescibacteria group bacterium]|nr:hypothetical protein [Patescibacteria group bacterium]
MSARDTVAVNQNASAVNDDAQEMLEGVVISGSWDAVNATCQILIGDTVGYEVPYFGDGISQPMLVTATLAVPAIGDQYGPVGGERAQVWESQGSYFAKLEHGHDDSPQAPAGERWILHRSAADPVSVAYDSGVKLTNDGPNPSDKLGGTHVGENGAISTLVTKAQTGVNTRDDIMKTGVGADPATLNPIVNGQPTIGNNATRQMDVQSALDATQLFTCKMFLKFTKAIIANGGLPTAPSAEALLATLIGPGFPDAEQITEILTGTAPITCPNCSQTVLIK